ncbi:tetratricopeptide repeat-containing diguanylate cyclase [Ideonella sp. BN130291]|uniref:tetratricopeptide repeat-containing diguanylate cyclase n=1 Tax=Ideonella sp. BN130291 TaxID=3112940 RepID=UPI002E271D36|nr:tetratricopeptide repeat-containing diguanylate cyclase [Ideonella sp. BN130291]
MPRQLALFTLLLSALPGLAGAAGAAAPVHPAQALVQRSVDAMRSDPDASRRHAEEALKLLAQQPEADLEVRARVQLCDYFSERDAALAAAQVKAARARLPQARRAGLQAGLLGCEAEIEEYKGNYGAALTLFDQAVQTAEAQHDGEMLADVLYQRGYLRGVQGDYAAGLADLRRARLTYERLGMAARAVTTFNGIAILYNRLGDHAQARHYFEQTLRAQTADGSKREVAVTRHNLGRVYENLKLWDKARDEFEATLDLSRQLDYARGEAYALRGLASVRNAEGEPAAALGLLQLAELLQKRVPDERLRAQILLQRGVALRQLKRPAEALPALEDALEIFRKADSLQETAATQQALAATQADAGDWKAAYDTHAQYTQTLERWLRNQLDQRFATLKVEFDTSAKERENVLLLRENAATENALAQARRASRLQVAVIVLAGALLVALGLLALHQRRHGRLMSRLALTDELTGLPNRRDVLGRLQALLAERRTRPCAAVIIDLDHFKSINDDFGHLVGDEMLKAVAEVLRAAVPEPACVGRLGGEEFIAVLPDTGEAQALQASETIREKIQALDASRWMPGTRQVTASLGVAVSRPGEDDLTSMLHRADEALYRAKAGGRNRVFAQAA